MLSEEEKEAIEQLRSWRKYIIEHRESVNKANDIEFYLRTALNLIENQQKELNNLKEIEKSHQEENGKLRVEFEKVYEDNLTLAKELEQEKEKNKHLEEIENKLMPLAECSYWDYEKHTCTHTCRGCDELSSNNRRSTSGILIDEDRYCRLYEDGYAEEDTRYVNVSDLIKRHCK